MRPHEFISALNQASATKYVGRVVKISQSHLESEGPLSSVGDICLIGNVQDRKMALVTAVDREKTVLMPFNSIQNISANEKVTLIDGQRYAKVGEALLGRLIDAMGNPLDDRGDMLTTEKWNLLGKILSPAERSVSEIAVRTGIRAIDGIMPIAEGQRLGIFAAAGVGKTSLIEQLATQSEFDNYVICLVGERGREVRALWDQISSQENRDKYCGFAATSDKSPIMRIRAVYQALSQAEYLRSKGRKVLFLLDSITRFAMALRELGLVSGEPPTQRAYTPNVFSALPKIVERCGARQEGGSITAFMTVLSETDDVDDPIVEIMKSLLDGHIILSRKLAEKSHFPAIDVLKSVSRQSERIMDAKQKNIVKDVISDMSIYEDARIMIESGIYKSGNSKEIDRAISNNPKILHFLKQSSDSFEAFENTMAKLQSLGGSSHA